MGVGGGNFLTAVEFWRRNRFEVAGAGASPTSTLTGARKSSGAM